MNKEQGSLAISIAIIIAGLMIAGAVYMTKDGGNIPSADDVKNPQQEQDQGRGTPREVTEDDHVMGNPNAKITIIEYSDTECPFCKRFHSVMNKVMETYGKDGSVKWVYRHLPFHKYSGKESEATECAAELGGNDKFWEYVNRLYELTEGNDTFEPEGLYSIAEYIKLDADGFKECLDSGRTAEKVGEDFTDGMNVLGTKDGTPHTVVIWEGGSTIIPGAWYYKDVIAVLDSILAEIE